MLKLTVIMKGTPVRAVLMGCEQLGSKEIELIWIFGPDLGEYKAFAVADSAPVALVDAHVANAANTRRITDKNLLFAATLVLDAARVRQNWFLVSLSMAA